MIRFVCPNCGATIKAPLMAAFKKSSCPRCQQRLMVPAPPTPIPNPSPKTMYGLPAPEKETAIKEEPIWQPPSFEEGDDQEELVWPSFDPYGVDTESNGSAPDKQKLNGPMEQRKPPPKPTPLSAPIEIFEEKRARVALTPCPECQHQISSTAKACPNCGYDQEAAKKKLEQAQAVKAGGIGCLAIIALSVIFALINSKDSSSTGDRPSTGEEGTLRVPSGGDVPVAVSQKANDRFTQLSVAKDLDGVVGMMLAGQIWNVPSGTRYRIILSGVYTYEVRILAGEHAHKACFVASDFVARK